jgi:hypothetical protein
LDRDTFNFIVKDAAARKREKYEEFLKSVPVLSSMDHYERSKLADAIKEEKFEAEDFIIKEVKPLSCDLLPLFRARQEIPSTSWLMVRPLPLKPLVQASLLSKSSSTGRVITLENLLSSKTNPEPPT